MKNNIKQLDSLILEVLSDRQLLNEKLPIDATRWEQLWQMDIEGSAMDISKVDTGNLEGSIQASDIFNLPQKGVTSGQNKLDLDDILYYQQNPDELYRSSQLQSKLIAIIKKYEQLTGGALPASKPATFTIDPKIKDAYKKRERVLDWKAWRFEMPKNPTAAQQTWNPPADHPDLIKYGQTKIERGVKYTPSNKNYRDELRKKEAKKFRDAADEARKKYSRYFANTRWARAKDENLGDLWELANASRDVLQQLDLAVDASAKKTQTLSNPVIKSQTGERGDWSPAITSMVERFFALNGGGNDITSRMNMISKISQTYYKAAGGDTASVNEINSKSPQQVLTDTQMLDFFNTLSKEMDAGTGAYQFEWFLAMMSGGQIMGKAQTSAGKMGAVDFVSGKGEWGSAKYYGKKGGIGQAPGGFTDPWLAKYGKVKPKDQTDDMKIEMSYVIGIKKQSIDQMADPANKDTLAKQGGKGTSDPDRLIAVQIYTPKVVYYGPPEIRSTSNAPAGIKVGFEIVPSGGGGKGYGASVTGADVIHTPTGGNPEVNISKFIGSPTGTVQVAMVRTETFREMMQKAVEANNTKAAVAFKAFKEYFDALQAADGSAKVYVNKGNIQDGNKVYANLQIAEERFTTVVGQLTQEQSGAFGDTVTSDPATRQTSLSEGKDLETKVLRLLKEKYLK